VNCRICKLSRELAEFPEGVNVCYRCARDPSFGVSDALDVWLPWLLILGAPLFIFALSFLLGCQS
jgi:hypothetical protein